MLILTLLLSLPPIANSSTEIRPLLIGQSVPAVTLTNIKGKAVKLQDLAKDRPVVVVFYRGGWCPFCNVQLAQLRKAYPRLQEIGYELVAITPDVVPDLQAMVDLHKLNYTLLSDPKHEAMRGFGLAFKTSAKDFGGSAAAAKAKPVLPVPGVFLVAKGGRILFQYVNPDFTVRLSGEVLLTAARAYTAQ